MKLGELSMWRMNRVLENKNSKPSQVGGFQLFSQPRRQYPLACWQAGKVELQCPQVELQLSPWKPVLHSETVCMLFDLLLIYTIKLPGKEYFHELIDHMGYRYQWISHMWIFIEFVNGLLEVISPILEE